MRATFARVAEKCDLPPLPAVAVRAMQLVRSAEATAEALAKVVSADAALAVRVLRISGSAIYGRRTTPKTLLDAITVVGFETLKKLLIAASARSVYAGRDPVVEALWAHALATALAADELAVLDGERRGGASFIAGLLHDIGRLVFHLSNRGAAKTLAHWDEAREFEVYGVTHPAVAGCLAEQWGLDEGIVAAIMFHHDADASPLAARLRRADLLAHQLGFGSVTTAIDGSEDPELAELGGRVLAAFERERAAFE